MERYGVVKFDSAQTVVSIEEKPEKPKSNYVDPAMYIYDIEVVNIAKDKAASPKGEYSFHLKKNNAKLKK